MKCSIIFAVSAELNNFLKMEVLVTLKHLKVTDRPGDVEKCLRKNGVRFLASPGCHLYQLRRTENAAIGLADGKIPATT